MVQDRELTSTTGPNAGQRMTRLLDEHKAGGVVPSPPLFYHGREERRDTFSSYITALYEYIREIVEQRNR